MPCTHICDPPRALTLLLDFVSHMETKAVSCRDDPGFRRSPGSTLRPIYGVAALSPRTRGSGTNTNRVPALDTCAPAEGTP